LAGNDWVVILTPRASSTLRLAERIPLTPPQQCPQTYRCDVSTPTLWTYTMDCPSYPYSINSGNVNSYNVTNNCASISSVDKVTADENREIMRWLSPLDPERRHHDIRADRLDGVGNWLLETKEFREWKSGEGGVDKAVLFCYGNPGVGKTYLW